MFEEIKKIEAEYDLLDSKLKNHNILHSKLNFYLSEDKESFLILWKKYILFFRNLKKLIKKSKYRSFFFIINYEKLIIRRYLLIFYFNCLVDLLKILGKHEEFIRIFLSENFKNNYEQIAKFIYRPNFINLVNTPSIFLVLFKKHIDKKYYFMLEKEKNNIGKNKRILTDYKNTYFYIKSRYLKILFFLSKSIGGVISKTKFSKRTKGLLSNKNILEYLKISKPGDIFLTRGNWEASNIVIPGFWKHMSMYLGNGSYLKKHFSKNFKFLKKLNNETNYVIEVTDEGVKILDIEMFISHNDYLGISRSQFSEEKVFRVIKKSLSFFGKPYDYILNFYSNNSVICSELIIKSYAKESSKDEGLEIKLGKLFGKLAYIPNSFVGEIFSEDSVFKPILFIDSIEKTGENFISTKEEFKSSGERSRYSFMLK